MILVVSRPEDQHGTAVLERLQAMCAPCRRLHARMLWTEGAYSVDPLAEGFGLDTLLTTWREFPEGAAGRAEPVSAIYWRRPHHREDGLMLDFPKAAEIAQAEAWHALRLAAEALPRELFPLGHPLDMKNAANKLRQLHLAARLGFSVPETVVSNDPVVLHAFLARHERVAVKPLHASIAYAESAREDTGRWIACRSFEASVLLDRLASGRRSQLLLQRAIPKKFDWRVTVLPHRTIACEIDTGSLPPGEPDWRLQSMSLPHRLIDLPDLFEGLLRSFLADIGLPVGYFDFAVDTDGTPWFLEMNTNAQWLWIEHLTGFPISREVAEALAARNL